MKSLIKNVVAITTLLVSALPMAGQTQPVDANGVKAITLSKGDNLSKHMKGDDKKQIRKLIIRESNEYDFSDVKDLLKTISKLPNLVELDVSGCSFLNSEFLEDRSSSYRRDQLILDETKIKRLVVSERDTPFKSEDSDDFSGNGWLLDRYIDKCSRLDLKKLGFKIFPSLEEYVVKNVSKPSGTYAPDSLYANIRCYENFVPVFMLNEGSLILKKVSDPTALHYQVLIQDEIIRWDKNVVIDVANIELKNVYCIRDYKFASTDNLVIPSTLCYMLYKDRRPALEATVENLVFEESENPIYLQRNALDELTINKTVTFNRPVVLQSHLKNFDNLTFNKTTQISKGGGFHRIKNIDFYGDAVIDGGGGSEIETITFYADATVAERSFGKVGILKFNKEPKLGKLFADFKKLYVPIGFKSKVPIYSITERRDVFEFAGNANLQARSIKIPQPGTLLSVISQEELASTDSLTIVGFMYETDTKVLSESATSLRYLDLSNTIITKSPAKQKEEAEEAEFFVGMVALMGLNADALYSQNRMSATKYFQVKGFTELVTSLQNADEGIKDCIVPYGLMESCTTLEEIILPSTATTMEGSCFRSCDNLKKIVFPKYLDYLGAQCFENCGALEEVTLPSSVTKIKKGCFSNCKSLKKVDFSACTLTSYEGIMFPNKNSMQEIRLPNLTKGLNTLSSNLAPKGLIAYIPEQCGTVDGTFREATVHFASPKVSYIVNQSVV